MHLARISCLFTHCCALPVLVISMCFYFVLIQISRTIIHSLFTYSKSLVASRPDDEVLELTILRGSNVAAQHEAAVVELCSNPDADDSVDQCVLEYLQGGYNVDDDDDSSSTSSTSSTLDEDANEGDILCDTEDDGDCLVDDLHNLWANDLPVQPTAAANGTTAIETDKNDDNDEPAAIKPWSSRASPSGTYVRDPVTGEMKNID